MTSETYTNGQPSARVAIAPKLRFEVLNRDNFACQYCGRRAPDVVLHVDHVHPVAEGGTNDLSNLRAACQPCNSGKGRTPLVTVAQPPDRVRLPDDRELITNHLCRRLGVGGVAMWRVTAIVDWAIRSGVEINDIGYFAFEEDCVNTLDSFVLAMECEVTRAWKRECAAWEADGGKF